MKRSKEGGRRKDSRSIGCWNQERPLRFAKKAKYSICVMFVQNGDDTNPDRLGPLRQQTKVLKS